MRKVIFKNYTIYEDGTIISPLGNEIKGSIDMGGYIYVSVAEKSYRKNRLMYEAFYGPIPQGLQVDHIDGVRTNNHINNLQLLTPSENSKKSWIQTPDRCTKRKAVEQYADREMTVLINTFKSYTDAGRSVGSNHRRIGEAARNGIAYKGYYWKTIE